MTATPNSNPNIDWAFPTFSPPTSKPSAQVEASSSDSESFYGGSMSLAENTEHSRSSTTQSAFYLPTLQQSGCGRGGDNSIRPTSVPRLPTTTVWGTHFARAAMNDAIDLVDQIVQNRTSEYIITANLNYLMLVEENPSLREVNQQCCCILADGNPIVWRSLCDDNPLPCRVAGSDMIVELARLSAEKGYRIFFLGGAPGIAKAAAEQLRQWFPQIQVAGTYSPPFRQLSADEHQQMLQRIREARTDILLVAFGQPKGELWIYENLEQLAVPLSIQLGASFDFLAGTVTRAPELWQKIGCEWLYRALSDPQRLFPRYGKNMMFLLGHLMEDAKILAIRYWKALLQPRLQVLLRRR